MKQNYKILIVDDNVIDQIVTKQLLKKKLNIDTIQVVSSGKEALEWLTNYKRESNDFLVILLDIKMPEMDGFEFLEEFEKLKNNLITTDFMIVMLSSSLDPNDKKRAKENANVKKLLSKPLRVEQFSLLLTKYTDES
jgi:CheY-like chemotaxis protein